MTYDVRVSARAERELEQAYLWYRANVAERADEWYNGFLDALTSLEHSADSHPLIPEPHSFRSDVRHLLYGRQRNWRAIFVIRGGTVVVLHIRHASRQPLRLDELP